MRPFAGDRHDISGEMPDRLIGFRIRHHIVDDVQTKYMGVALLAQHKHVGSAGDEEGIVNSVAGTDVPVVKV